MKWLLWNQFKLYIIDEERNVYEKKCICSSFFKLSLIDWQQTVARQLVEKFSVSQVKFTCSNGTIETLERRVI